MFKMQDPLEINNRGEMVIAQVQSSQDNLIF